MARCSGRQTPTRMQAALEIRHLTPYAQPMFVVGCTFPLWIYSLISKETRRMPCLDDRLTPLYALTFANRLRALWYRCKHFLTAISCTMKLLLLARQNLLVLRHFRHCRAVEPLQKRKQPRFRSFTFYKETLHKSRQLFSPLWIHHDSSTACVNRQSLIPQIYQEHYAELHFNLVDPSATPLQQTPRRGRHRIRAAFLWLWHTPYRLMQHCRYRQHERQFRAKIRQLRRQEQTILLRERHRALGSAQAALFLSLANTIDLRSTKELTVLCQHVTKKRHRKKLTAEDISCFDKTLSDIDTNYATLLTTVQ